MFKRRQRPPLKDRFLGFFWPRIGWKRSSQYVGHRVARLPGTPYSIAAGFACGAAISFTPFVGLHLFAGALLAWAMRGNVIASWIGTLIGNPWTFPFIWIGIYRLGILMGAGEEDAPQTLDFLGFFEQLITAFKSLDLVYIGEISWPVLWPMMVGGAPLFLISWPICFFLVKALVSRYHTQRLKKRIRAKSSRYTPSHPTE